jgi:hypothetical protein
MPHRGPFHDPFDARPERAAFAHHGPPARAEVLFDRLGPAVAIAAIDGGRARFASTLPVPAVDDDFDSIVDELAMERPEQ